MRARADCGPWATEMPRAATLTEQAGGTVVIADSPSHLEGLFLKLLAEMQSRYLLTYYPKGVNRAGWHTLDVRLRSGKGQVKARQGYYVAPR